MFYITERLASTLKTISAALSRGNIGSRAGGVVGGEDGGAPRPRPGPAGGHPAEEHAGARPPLVALRSHQAGRPLPQLAGLQVHRSTEEQNR